MARQVFVDIDTQYDFISADGALSVPGAENIRENLRALTNYAIEHGVKTIASADAHAPDDREFEIFPPHCVQGTPGQKKIEETCVANTQVIENTTPETNPHEVFSKADQILLEKQTYDVFTNLNTVKLIKAANADEHIVYGVATDYCVRAAVCGLLDRGYQVIVVKDAIAAVEQKAGEDAVAMMKEQGAIFKKTRDIIGR